jgi:hypothetical protein
MAGRGNYYKPAGVEGEISKITGLRKAFSDQQNKKEITAGKESTKAFPVGISTARAKEILNNYGGRCPPYIPVRGQGSLGRRQ